MLLLVLLASALLGLAGGVLLGGSPGEGTTPTLAPEESTSTSLAGMTAERAREIGANELGRIMVLEYHLIGGPPSEQTRSPEDFRDDLALLKREGFYPVNLRDLATGNLEVPAGKTPVVITFDESSPGQYRILDDQTIDPDCAVGIMEAAVRGGDWASRASFFVLLDVRPDDRVLFGQPELATQKLRSLVGWGYEVGSQTVTYLDLGAAATEDIVRELADSQATIEDLVDAGYVVDSLSVPFGSFPEDLALLAGGDQDDQTYRYIAVVDEGGGVAPSPFSTEFDPMRIPRIVVQGDALRAAIQAFKDDPSRRYVSDGDPAAVSVPVDVADDLGALRADLGRPIITY